MYHKQINENFTTSSSTIKWIIILIIYRLGGIFADSTSIREYIYLGKPESQQVKPPENQSRSSVSEPAMSSWSGGCPSSVKEKPKEPESNVPPRCVKYFDRFRITTNQRTLLAGKYFLRNTYGTFIQAIQNRCWFRCCSREFEIEVSLHQNEPMPSEGLAIFCTGGTEIFFTKWLFEEGGAGAYEEQKTANVVFISQKL